MSAALASRSVAPSALLNAVMALAGERARLLAHAERPWGSVTFSGARHRILVQYEGEEAIAQGEALIHRFPDHEFDLPRQVVADAVIAAVEYARGLHSRLKVELEVLALEKS